MWCRAVDSSNLILPAGDVRIGNKDYNIYANSQFPTAKSMNQMPLKSVGNGSVLVADIGHAVDAGALQYNIVRINGQRSVYVPIFKQGGNSNTITIVDGMKAADQASGRYSGFAENRRRVRPVGVCEAGALERRQGRRYRPGPDRPHDSAVSGQSARHHRGACCPSRFRRWPVC